MNTTIRDRIKVVCNKKGISLTDLEKLLGFGNGTVCRWDETSPRCDKITKVADYLDVSMDYLLGREKKETIHLSDDAIIIAKLFDSSDDLSKDMVRRILGIKQAQISGKTDVDAIARINGMPKHSEPKTVL